MQYNVKYNESEPDNLDLYAVLDDGSEVLILSDVVEAGCKWAVDQMALVDGSNREQVALLAADLRKRMPVRFSYVWQQMEYRRLQNLPARKWGGRFASQGRA